MSGIMSEKENQICSNYVMDTTESKIVFDENGKCEYCNSYNKHRRINKNRSI
jgi:hypothetical protein